MGKYLKDKELDSVLESYFEETITPTKSNHVVCIDEECEVYYDTIHEAAKFKFLPKIKRNEDLKKVWSDCEKAQEILNDNGTDVDKGEIVKIGDLALRILRTIDEASCILALPICLTVVGIPVYLLCRLIVYAERIGEDMLGEMYAKKVIASLNKLKSDSKDPKVKAKVDEQLEKVKDSLKELKEEK